ncbi:hypothetical protein [Micromonospora sp. WMMD736]|uniref:YncE family protein n=1 Tax=Micromonospora sp. WMMD736 TaxID=3404112 RepID=UPI003B93B464
MSPPATEQADGTVQPLPGAARSAWFDAATRSLVVLSPDVIRVVTAEGVTQAVGVPPETTAMTGDGRGRVYLSMRGGYLRFDIADGELARFDVAEQSQIPFTAVARRADGNLVLGSADGAVYTLASDTTVGARVDGFARIDALVTQGNTTVVLDRGQTSVTTLDGDGARELRALRAGAGATTIAADPVGRVLVADTRGGELLVFGTDPLILRQRYPVAEAPYGLAGSSTLAWVSQTATNTVIGYDLATGIPVEKVRYRTVQQPDSLAYDDSSDTLYVVSGSGAGVQVITDAAGRR